MQNIFTSLIQSNFGSDEHGNFEAVIKVNNDLLHYWRDNTNNDLRWKPGRPISLGNVAFPGAIIQSDYRRHKHGNFEVVVPLNGPHGHAELWHFYHDNINVDNEWVKVRRVTHELDQVAGPASLIQSDYRRHKHGNFEVVVPLRGPRGHVELWHFYHDNINVDNEWVKVRRVTHELDQVAGPASLIQSDFTRDGHGNFEVVVPLKGPHGHVELWHFYHDNINVDNEWVKVRRVTHELDQAAGPGVIIQSDLKSGDHGNFEVVVPLQMPDGHIELRHFWHDNARLDRDWQYGQMITASANGWACIIRSDYGEDNNNFEILVEECRQSIVHYWHDNSDISHPWLRDEQRPWLIGEQPIAALPNARKIVQLTGEVDRENWKPKNGDPLPLTHNQTESKFGIRGTDLGVSFVHNGHIYFLFGDTWREPYREAQLDLDSIAFSTSLNPNPDDGLDLTFYRQPPLILTGNISQRGFEVPLDGLSLGRSMIVFFSTDHYTAGDYDLMGRSVVARSDDHGYTFDYLYEFSREKFINVSLDQFPTGETIGLPGYQETLLIWGSGRYRSSDVYLAAMPLTEIAGHPQKRYYAGQRNLLPFWSDREEEAVPLFCAGCVGELSVRWNQFLERWIILYNSDNPRGIIMRSAPQPWGPWSGPIMAFDPDKGGYGHFMHAPWKVGAESDYVYDNMFRSGDGSFPWRGKDPGGEYGPYQIAPLARGENNVFTQIYFTMSTWNPYQVMLMTTTISADSL